MFVWLCCILAVRQLTSVSGYDSTGLFTRPACDRFLTWPSFERQLNKTFSNINYHTKIFASSGKPITLGLWVWCSTNWAKPGEYVGKGIKIHLSYKVSGILWQGIYIKKKFLSLNSLIIHHKIWGVLSTLNEKT